MAHPDAPRAVAVISKLEEFRGEVQEELSPEELERQFKDPRHPLRLAIVCDMWLTGFDIPALHTMYIDKPLKGHTLMQAIARTNRVYKDKPAGLIVDYIGIAGELKKALSLYSSDVKNQGVFPIEEAIRMMLKKHRIVSDFFADISWQSWTKLRGKDLANLFQAAVSAVIGEGDRIEEERKQRFLVESVKLEKLHALIMPHQEAGKIRNDVSFFEAVKQAIYRHIMTPQSVRGTDEGTESAIRELVGESFSAQEPIDLFASEGKAKPEISIFDERFLAEVKKMRFKNLAIETLRKLLRDELRGRMRINMTRYEPLRQMLEEIIEQYENNIISSADVIERLIDLAKQIKELEGVNVQLGLSQEELAFYDALSDGKKVLKDDERMKTLVKELVRMIRHDAAIDWTNNEMIQSRIRTNVHLLLLRNGFTTEETSSLIERILEQAKNLFSDRVFESV